MTTEKPSRRRRHDYGPEIADLICERLMDGESLRQICQDRSALGQGGSELSRPQSFQNALNLSGANAV